MTGLTAKQKLKISYEGILKDSKGNIKQVVKGKLNNEQAKRYFQFKQSKKELNDNDVEDILALNNIDTDKRKQ